MPANARPPCADSLPLVDATFDRSKVGNAAARELAALCRRCPIAAECFEEGMRHPEQGVWGGTRRGYLRGSLYGGHVKVVA